MTFLADEPAWSLAGVGGRNRMAEGLTVENLLGSRFVDWVPQEHRQVVKEAVAKVVTLGRPQEYGLLGYGPGGEWAHYHVRFSPEMAGDRVIGAVAMVTDVSERIKAEQEKLALDSQLCQAQKMEAIGTLASGIAHDFNNILAAIFSFAELAVEAAKSGQDNRRDSEQILIAAGRARDLVQQILTFSRKVEPQRRPINFNQEISRGLMMLGSSLPKMISIKTRLAPDLMCLNADPGQMNQVLMNLATNAAQAMPEGGELNIFTKNVEVAERACATCAVPFSGRFVRLTVADTGTGVGPSIVGRIFDPFLTTKEVGQSTGLGLSTVQGIVKGHSGHIEYDGKPGKVSRFSVYLLGLVMESTPCLGEKQAEEPLPGGNETILVVDDEESLPSWPLAP